MNTKHSRQLTFYRLNVSNFKMPLSSAKSEIYSVQKLMAANISGDTASKMIGQTQTDREA